MNKFVQIPGYILLLDESAEIKRGDKLVFRINNVVPFEMYECLGFDVHGFLMLYDDLSADKTMCKKVVAHLPLNNCPALKGVDLIQEIPTIQTTPDVNKMQAVKTKLIEMFNSCLFEIDLKQTGSVFLKREGTRYFHYQHNGKRLWCSQYVWDDLEEEFNVDDDDIKECFGELMYELFDIKNVTAYYGAK